MPSPLGRVPPQGAGEVRYAESIDRWLSENSYCGNTSSTASGPPSPKGKARVQSLPYPIVGDGFPVPAVKTWVCAWVSANPQTAGFGTGDPSPTESYIHAPPGTIWQNHNKPYKRINKFMPKPSCKTDCMVL